MICDDCEYLYRSYFDDDDATIYLCEAVDDCLFIANPRDECVLEVQDREQAQRNKYKRTYGVQSMICKNCDYVDSVSVDGTPKYFCVAVDDCPFDVNPQDECLFEVYDRECAAVEDEWRKSNERNMKRAARRKARFKREMRMRKVVTLSYCPHVGWIDRDRGYFKDASHNRRKAFYKKQSNRRARKCSISTRQRSHHKKDYELLWQIY